MKKLACILFLLLPSTALPVEWEEETVVSSCVLAMTVTAQPFTADDVAGIAVIELTLRDKEGAPLPGVTMAMSANCGTFMCRLPDDPKPEDEDEERACFRTKDNGIARLYLTNIPFNAAAKVKAQCDCGDYLVNATGSLMITKKRTVK